MPTFQEPPQEPAQPSPERLAIEQAREKLAQLPASTWEERHQLIYLILAALLKAVELLAEQQKKSQPVQK